MLRKVKKIVMIYLILREQFIITEYLFLSDYV
jgi:hypothetical protein